MAHKYSTFFRWIHVLADYLILNISLHVFFATSNSGPLWMNEYDYRLIILLLNLWWFYCSNVLGVYNNILTRDSVATLKAIITCLGLFTIITFAFKVVFPGLFVSTNTLLYFFLFFPASILAWKTIFLYFRKHRRNFWMHYNKCAIVGAGTSGRNLYNYIMANPQLGYEVQGFFADSLPQDRISFNYLGKIKDSISVASANGIQEIYCTLPHKKSSKIKKLRRLADQHMVRFRMIPHIKGSFDRDDLLELNGAIPIVLARPEPLDNKAKELLKWAFDMVFASLVTIFLLSWLTPIIAIIIKLDSPGPVFFKQLRSGKDNKPFYCLKFRSMAPNKDCDTVQATEGDMRVTRVGAFLRKTSLDELPQFFNVLKGEMSVVGPRPHMLKHTSDYSELIRKYMVRQFLTPGITGWAQVNGFRGETRETSAMENRVRADIWYMKNWTLFLDLKIVFLTFWQVFVNRQNAY